MTKTGSAVYDCDYESPINYSALQIFASQRKMCQRWCVVALSQFLHTKAFHFDILYVCFAELNIVTFLYQIFLASAWRKILLYNGLLTEIDASISFNQLRLIG